ncbi:MAG: HIT domain-containing protein [Aigarchaeota archaeon]|nr:HIT domain-containing protein [Aigarchaeota archaeon]MCX8192924.1 HIT domain-containing protein [Nitrososphaeria archaeon]MDW7986431.1 HIT domain-containing protein [Nitrososphaerota archaeon]
MKIIWAPWRMKYIKQHLKGKGAGKCIFCIEAEEDKDLENLVLYRGEKCFIILNKYPYTSGHLMIAPYRHVGELERLDEKELCELMNLTVISIKALKKEYNPSGLNIGANIGRAAGAGVEDHLHFHVVPRWVGDTNFMPVISDTKIIPELPEETYGRLIKYFKPST